MINPTNTYVCEIICHNDDNRGGDDDLLDLYRIPMIHQVLVLILIDCFVFELYECPLFLASLTKITVFYTEETQKNGHLPCFVGTRLTTPIPKTISI